MRQRSGVELSLPRQTSKCREDELTLAGLLVEPLVKQANLPE